MDQCGGGGAGLCCVIDLEGKSSPLSELWDLRLVERDGMNTRCVVHSINII